MHTANFAGINASYGNPSRTPPSSYAPNPRNHLLLGGGSPDLGVGLLDLVAGLIESLDI